MSRRRSQRVGLFIGMIALVAACDQAGSSDFIAPQFAKQSGTPATFTFSAPTVMAPGSEYPLIVSAPSSFGISSDGSSYVNGVGAVQAYIGVGGKDTDLVTYSTSRKLHYAFDPNSAALKAAGIPASLDAVTAYSGINYWGRYIDMTVGTVATVQGDFEFYVGTLTYEVKYTKLAVKRLSTTEWLITTDCAKLDTGGCWSYGGAAPNPSATLAVIRRNAQTTYGTVQMPVTFLVKI